MPPDLIDADTFFHTGELENAVEALLDLDEMIS
jgi:hypothetical protein